MPTGPAGGPGSTIRCQGLSQSVGSELLIPPDFYCHDEEMCHITSVTEDDVVSPDT